MKRLIFIALILVACSKDDDTVEPITTTTETTQPPTQNDTTYQSPAKDFIGSWGAYYQRLTSTTQGLFADTVTLRYIDSTTLLYLPLDKPSDTFDVSGINLQSRSKLSRTGMMRNDTLRISDSSGVNQFNWDYFKLP